MGDKKRESRTKINFAYRAAPIGAARLFQIKTEGIEEDAIRRSEIHLFADTLNIGDSDLSLSRFGHVGHVYILVSKPNGKSPL